MRARRLAAYSIVVLLHPVIAAGQAGRQFYEDRCAMCHSIGGEPAAGPDLKDIASRRDREWLLRFILDPESAAKTDRDAAALVKQFDNAMPATEGASRAELEAVLDYIAAQSAAGAAAPPAAITGDPAVGRELYAGRRGLANGAPACTACHRLDDIGGGALGPDLTGVHRRLGGARGLAAWMGNPPTPVMRAVYRTAPLTTEEAHALAALLADAPARPPAPRRMPAVLGAGAGGAALGLIVFAVAWSRRFRGVRRPMLARAAGGHQ